MGRIRFGYFGDEVWKVKKMYKLIDIDDLREEFGVSADCANCLRTPEECANNRSYTMQDICILLDEKALDTEDAIPIKWMSDNLFSGSGAQHKAFERVMKMWGKQKAKAAAGGGIDDAD